MVTILKIQNMTTEELAKWLHYNYWAYFSKPKIFFWEDESKETKQIWLKLARKIHKKI